MQTELLGYPRDYYQKMGKCTSKQESNLLKVEYNHDMGKFGCWVTTYILLFLFLSSYCSCNAD